MPILYKKNSSIPKSIWRCHVISFLWFHIFLMGYLFEIWVWRVSVQALVQTCWIKTGYPSIIGWDILVQICLFRWRIIFCFGFVLFFKKGLSGLVDTRKDLTDRLVLMTSAWIFNSMMSGAERDVGRSKLELEPPGKVSFLSLCSLASL